MDERGRDDERGRGQGKTEHRKCREPRCEHARPEPYEEDGGQHQQSRKPNSASDVQHHEGGRDRERKRDHSTQPLLAQRPRHERHDQGQQSGGCDFLDSAPEGVSVEQCRLGGDEGHERPKRPQLEDGAGQRIENERQNGSGEHDRRLEEPRRVFPGQNVPEAEGQERPDRVAGAEVVAKYLRVRRLSEPGDIAAVLHGAVGESKPRGRVVERDVAGERRLSRKDDRRGIDREHADHAGQGPAVQPPPAPRVREPVPGDGEHEDEGRREPGGRAAHGGECGGHDDDREPDRQQQCARQTEVGRPLDEQAAADRDHAQHEREDDPADEDRHGRTAKWTESCRARLIRSTRSADRANLPRADDLAGLTGIRIEDLDLVTGSWKGEVDVRRQRA